MVLGFTTVFFSPPLSQNSITPLCRPQHASLCASKNCDNRSEKLMLYKDLSIGKEIFVSSFGNLSYIMASLNYNKENSFDLYLAKFVSQRMSRESSLQLLKALFFDHRPRKMLFLTNFPHLSFLYWVFKQIHLFLLWY